MVRREIGAERWASHGNQTVAMHTGALSELARRWNAVWEIGASVAALDGVTALHHAGMSGFDEETVHLSVKHTVEVEGVEGVKVHKVIRRLPNGAAYLDVWWEEAALAVEVDGTGHLRGLQMVDDDLRQNEVQLGNDLVLRVGILGWRLVPNRYLDQVCVAYWSRRRRPS